VYVRMPSDQGLNMFVCTCKAQIYYLFHFNSCRYHKTRSTCVQLHHKNCDRHSQPVYQCLLCVHLSLCFRTSLTTLITTLVRYVCYVSILRLQQNHRFAIAVITVTLRLCCYFSERVFIPRLGITVVENLQ